FEGRMDQKHVADIAKRLADTGAQDIILADTIGAAVPNQVQRVLAAVAKSLPPDIRLGCHFHNTRNTGYANAVAALDHGVRLFDASLGGIGGCPFAPRATGNIASEDLAHMLGNMGYEVSADLGKLIETAQWAEQFFEAPLPGMLMKAGPFP
ncbi:MAG: hydroxymethylglutaryl-CoA lyase, partial [Alphaproteobacteria bacterium]